MPAFRQQTQRPGPSADQAAPPHSQGRGHPLLGVPREPLRCVLSIESQQSPSCLDPRPLLSSPWLLCPPQKSSRLCNLPTHKLKTSPSWRTGGKKACFSRTGASRTQATWTLCPASYPPRTALPRALDLLMCGVHHARAKKF